MTNAAGARRSIRPAWSTHRQARPALPGSRRHGVRFRAQRGTTFGGPAGMAKPPPEKNSPERRVLPMDLQVGDRIEDETGEYEIIGRPYTTNMGKDAHVRVKRVDNAEVTMIRTYAAHERIAVRRG